MLIFINIHANHLHASFVDFEIHPYNSSWMCRLDSCSCSAVSGFELSSRMTNKSAVSDVDLVKIKTLFRDDKSRFQLEIEFVELLANPWYLQHLAQSRYFDDQNFLNYLEYLQYWSKPEYIKFLSHPHCLYFLEMLQKPEFRQQLLNPSFVDLIHTNQYWHWRSYRFNRYRQSQQDEADAAAATEQKQLQQSGGAPAAEQNGLGLGGTGASAAGQQTGAVTAAPAAASIGAGVVVNGR